MCTRCAQTKHKDEFYNSRERPDGKFPWCKECSIPYVVAMHKKARNQRKENKLQRKMEAMEKALEMLKNRKATNARQRNQQEKILRRFGV